jgi:type I restriction enzyme S subunit
VPKDDVDSKFLYYLMGSKSALLNEMATGVTIRYLSREKFSNLLVSIPSLPEQQRIVRLLDELVGASDVLASAYVKKLAALDDLQKSSLNQAFRGELEVA